MVIMEEGDVIYIENVLCGQYNVFVMMCDVQVFTVELQSRTKQIRSHVKKVIYVPKGNSGSKSQGSGSDYVNDEGRSGMSRPLESVDKEVSISSSDQWRREVRLKNKHNKGSRSSIHG